MHRPFSTLEIQRETAPDHELQVHALHGRRMVLSNIEMPMHLMTELNP
jgi:hypothetical protein